MIEHRADGTTLITDDGDASRTRLLTAGTSQVDEDAAIVAFFAVATPPPLPDVPMYKVVALLITEGLLEQVNAFIAGLPQPDQAQALNLFTRAPNLVASSSLPVAIQAALGKTDMDYRAFVLTANGLEI